MCTGLLVRHAAAGSPVKGEDYQEEVGDFRVVYFLLAELTHDIQLLTVMKCVREALAVFNDYVDSVFLFQPYLSPGAAPFSHDQD